MADTLPVYREITVGEMHETQPTHVAFKVSGTATIFSLSKQYLAKHDIYEIQSGQRFEVRGLIDDETIDFDVLFTCPNSILDIRKAS